MKITKAVLRRVRKLIDKGWTKGAFARDEKSMIVDCEGSRAACFCLQGAARRVGAGYDDFARALGFRGPHPTLQMVYWNDGKHRRKAHVLARLDKAIEQAPSR